MIEHRGIKIVAGFAGDPSWIDPTTPSIGEIDRATNRGPIAFDWYDIAAAVPGSGRAHDIASRRTSSGQEIPARVASQPDAAGIGGTTLGGRSVVSPQTSGGAGERFPRRPAAGAFSARADASGYGRASKKEDAT
jgi:hypothetical protein